MTEAWCKVLVVKTAGFDLDPLLLCLMIAIVQEERVSFFPIFFCIDPVPQFLAPFPICLPFQIWCMQCLSLSGECSPDYIRQSIDPSWSLWLGAPTLAHQPKLYPTSWAGKNRLVKVEICTNPQKCLTCSTMTQK